MVNGAKEGELCQWLLTLWLPLVNTGESLILSANNNACHQKQTYINCQKSQFCSCLNAYGHMYQWVVNTEWHVS